MKAGVKLGKNTGRLCSYICQISRRVKRRYLPRFWNNLTECVGSFRRNEQAVFLGDLNARLSGEVIRAIV